MNKKIGKINTGVSFDAIGSGMENMSRDEYKQLSLIDYEQYKDITFPELPKQEKKARQPRKKKVAESPKEEVKAININSIKTVKAKKKHTEEGVGVLAITGCETASNKVVSTISIKSKKEIEDRNKELLRLKEHPYIKRELLTTAEKKLYRFLRSRIQKEVTIFTKVRLGDLVDTNEVITRNSKAFWAVACKHVDFVIVDANLDLICVVELDDYTHETPEAMRRDEFVAGVLRDCNIQLYRIGVRIDLITPADTRFIELHVLEHMAPTCPKCGRPMVPKESRRKSNYGHRFYGCMGYDEKGENQCTYNIDID